jgi:predicted DNA-binding transcriptional regulator YafY
MADSETSRLSRLAAIMTQLQSKTLITAKEIADRHQVSIRTIYRDIRALEQAGIPIATEEGKGYTLVKGFKLPPIMFSEEEANALVTAEQLITKNKDQSFVNHYKDAITKIKAVLRYSEKDKLELLAQRVVFRQNLDNDTTSNHLSKIQKAITNFKVTQIEYFSLNDELSHRTIEPFALYSTQENWIMIAWCRLRKDFRAFRLDRIRALNLLAENFEPQQITLQEYFEICREKYSGHP